MLGAGSSKSGPAARCEPSKSSVSGDAHGSTEWSIRYDDLPPDLRGLHEALCAVGNGFFVTRGTHPEARADAVNYPGTYVAGLYNRLTTAIGGRKVENEDLVNLPNWLLLRFRISPGAWFDTRAADVLEHRLELDLWHGTLTRHLRWGEPDGRTTAMVQRRFVSMKDAHLAGLETTFTAENWSGTLEIASGVDGRVANTGVKRYRSLSHRHLRVPHVGEADDQTVELLAETTQSQIRIAVAARTTVVNGAGAGRRLVTERGAVMHELSLDLERGRPATVEKIAAVYTSRDRAISECLLAARQAAGGAPGFADLLTRHAAAWESLWSRFNIRLDRGNRWAEKVLHLHTFHLLATISQNSIWLDTGVPARGWHGEAYRGHVFWDELFVFPLLNFQFPGLAGALLRYRYERLGAARAAAKAAGYSGAMFPWQSGSDGREESQRLHLNPRSGRWLPDNSRLQRHVGIAVAYNVWQHYLVTGDIPFLRFIGAELLIEIARFWASVATYNSALDRYEIRGVMGPDEYHDSYPDADRPGLDNNTYTNVMAVWVLRRAAQALDELSPHYRREVTEDLGLGPVELGRWRDIAAKMRVVFHEDGVLAQFEGDERLSEFDFAGYRARYGDIQRLDRLLEAEGDTTNRYQVCKQPDVVMLLYLLSGDELRDLLGGMGYGKVTDEQLRRTVDYHLARSADGSSLSSVVNSWVLARIDPARGWRRLLRALESDVGDAQGGTTAEGIHLGAMAGTVDVVLRGITGMSADSDGLRFDPVLPPQVRTLRFSAHFRGHRLAVSLTRNCLTIISRRGDPSPIRVTVREQVREVAPGTRAEFPLGGAPVM
jgi:trehalose/maltose hydrolase-like predicted phosphorylase